MTDNHEGRLYEVPISGGDVRGVVVEEGVDGGAEASARRENMRNWRYRTGFWFGERTRGILIFFGAEGREKRKMARAGRKAKRMEARAKRQQMRVEIRDAKKLDGYEGPVEKIKGWAKGINEKMEKRAEMRESRLEREGKAREARMANRAGVESLLAVERGIALGQLYAAVNGRMEMEVEEQRNLGEAAFGDIDEIPNLVGLDAEAFGQVVEQVTEIPSATVEVNARREGVFSRLRRAVSAFRDSLRQPQQVGEGV